MIPKTVQKSVRSTSALSNFLDLGGMNAKLKNREGPQKFYQGDEPNLGKKNIIFRWTKCWILLKRCQANLKCCFKWLVFYFQLFFGLVKHKMTSWYCHHGIKFSVHISAADWVCLDGFGDLISLLGKQFHPYCWWQPEIRRSVTTWGKGSFHHYVQGFIHLRWLAGFLPSTVSPKVVWTLALQFGVSKESPGHQLKCS